MRAPEQREQHVEMLRGMQTFVFMGQAETISLAPELGHVRWIYLLGLLALILKRLDFLPRVDRSCGRCWSRGGHVRSESFERLLWSRWGSKKEPETRKASVKDEVGDTMKIFLKITVGV